MFTRCTRRMAVSLIALALCAASASAQNLNPGVVLQSHVEAALKQGNDAAAIAETSRLLRQNPQAAAAILKRQAAADSTGRAARIAFEASRQIAWEAADAAVGRMTPQQRKGLISVEMAGSAGWNHQAPGKAYSGRDLDVQGRGSRESAAAFRDRMAEVTREWGLVAQTPSGDTSNPLKINPFAALPEGERVARTTGDLATGQLDTARQYADQRSNPEASKGEAAEAVKRYYYDTGAARVVQGASLSPREIAVSDVYELKQLAPPKVTPTQAFGVVANEQAQFHTFDKDGAKHLARAADALDVANPDAMTKAERETATLAKAMYQTHDQVAAINKLAEIDPTSSILRDYRAGIAPAVIFEREAEKGRALLERAAQETTSIKLQEFERMRTMSDAIVNQKRDLAAQGDPGARDWVREYDATKSGAAKGEMARNAREQWLEKSRQGLVEGLLALKPDLKDRLVDRFSKSDLLQNLNVVADAMTGRLRGVAEANEFVKSHVGPDGPVGRMLDRANGLLMAMAAAGVLKDVVKDVQAAYDRGGAMAAGVVLGGSVLTRGGIEFLTPLLLQSAALHAAEAAGLVTGATAAVAFAPLLVRDLTAMVTGAYGALWNSYLVNPALQRMMDPANPTSFFRMMSGENGAFTPDTLHADLQAFARARGLDPNDMNAVLAEALKDYLTGQRSGAMTGLPPELLKALLAADDQSKQYLELIARLAMNDKLTELGRVAADLDATAKKGNAVASGKSPQPAPQTLDDQEQEAKAEAEAAAAKAKALADAKKKKDKKKDAVPAVVVKAPAPKTPPSPPPPRTAQADSDGDSRWKDLAAEGEQAASAVKEARLSLTLGRASVAPGERMAVTARLEAPPDAPLGNRVQFSVSRGRLDQSNMTFSASGVALAIYTPPANFAGPVTVTARVAGLPSVSRTVTVEGTAGAGSDQSAGADPDRNASPSAPPPKAPTPAATRPPAQPAPPASPVPALPADSADDAQGVKLEVSLSVASGTMQIAPNAALTGTLTIRLAPKGTAEGGCTYESNGTTTYTISGTFDPNTRAFRGTFTSRGDLTTHLKCTTPELGDIPGTFDYSLLGGGRCNGTLRADGSFEWKSQEEFKATDTRNPRVTSNTLDLSENGTWRRVQ